jgi:tetratricopeptide (TPR) repeat protein
MTDPAASGAALGRAAARAAMSAGQPREAFKALKAALIAGPGDRESIELLTGALEALGEKKPRARALTMARALELHHPLLTEAAASLGESRWGDAERMVRSVLAEMPGDPSAERLLAQVAIRIGRHEDAERLLLRVVETAPDFAAAHFDLAGVLYARNRLDEAICILNRLLDRDPLAVEYRMLKAAALSRLGRTDEALAVYEQVLANTPADAAAWTLYGHALRTRGRQAESVAAYRRAISIDPASGIAWFSLANLKTVQLTPADAAAIGAALQRPGLGDEDRVHLHFALGKAAEDAEDFRLSFANYAAGNRLVRAGSRYRAEDTTDLVRRSEALFDAAYFEAVAGSGAASDAPIFILGMPRSGSTLVEQILASHPEVEGTAELPYIPLIGGQAAAERREAYPEFLARLDGRTITAMGEEYLARSLPHRREGRRLFIDKNPPNWLHIGLIRTILPGARMIDVRRHPLACGFSNFKQHFAHGEGFAYALEDIGAYYRDYVRLLRHFDTVQPGRVYRLVYERLIDDPEPEVRRLLDHLGLAFDPACMRFWETERVVRTYSSEQVRRPINREGIDQWRSFEPWLEPLKEALGPELDEYRYDSQS